MKACFLLQRRFAFVGNKIAKILKEKHGVTKFCGYVYQRSSYEFLKKQKDVDYTSLILDEEIHKQYKDEKIDLGYLKNLEKEYGIPNLWPYIAIDRVLMYSQLIREYPNNTPLCSHDDMLRILQVKAKAVISFLEKEKPDFVFITVIGGMGSMLLYHIAKKKNIPVFIGIETRIDDGYTLTEDYRNFSFVEKKFEEIQKDPSKNTKLDKAKEFIKSFREKPSTYLYSQQDMDKKDDRFNRVQHLSLFRIFRSIVWFIKMTTQYIVKNKKSDHDEENPIHFFIDKIKRKTRMIIGFTDLYDDTKEGEDYAYFPLHYEPEISLMLYAPFWGDQINLIKQTAKSLPAHFKLYVKEHPGMYGFRTREYYKEIKKIPNVKLLAPETNTFELVKNSKLVTTITGTVGWEALLFKKPVIAFGDVYYNKLSFVKKCTEIEKLPILVKEQLENFEYNDRELEQFVSAILEESEEIGLLKIWELELKDVLSDNKDSSAIKRLEILADLIYKKANN